MLFVRCLAQIQQLNQNHLRKLTLMKNVMQILQKKFLTNHVIHHMKENHRLKQKVSHTNELNCFIIKKYLILGYGYGFLAVFIVSALSLAGLLAFPILYKVSFQYVLKLFTALAVGTLFGDTMFHLIPFVCNLKAKEKTTFLYYLVRHLVFTVIMTGMVILQFQSLIMYGKC
jgi:hypothetical protein